MRVGGSILALFCWALLAVSCVGVGADGVVSVRGVDSCVSESQRVALAAAGRMVPSGMTVRSGERDLALLGQVVRVGDRAPDFRCVGVDSGPVGLSSFPGMVKVLSVFPSLDTRVCSLQTRTFNERVLGLSGDVVVVSLSTDLPFAMGRYCGAEGLDAAKMVMASDHQSLDFGLRYGMVLDGLRLLTRAVVVVDRADVVRYVEYVERLSAEPDYDRALECVAGLLAE